MKRAEYQNLSDEQLMDGMKTCYSTSLDHYENGIFNAKSFGLGVALFIISVEELIKANTMLIVYIGFGDHELIDFAFKSRDKHRARLKIALGLSQAYEIINSNDFVNKIEEKIENSGVNLNITSVTDLLNFDWLADLQNQIQPFIQDDISDITNSSKEIESTLKEHTNWFLHAQNLKERGLYSDLSGDKWRSPRDLTQQDYEEAQSHTQQFIEQVGFPVKMMIEASEFKRRILRPMMKQFIEMVKFDDDNG